MATALVVHYSHSGHTKAAAEEIGRRLGADIEPISAAGRGPRGVFSSVRTGFASLSGRTWAIDPPTRDAAAYDLVVLCAPVCAPRSVRPGLCAPVCAPRSVRPGLGGPAGAAGSGLAPGCRGADTDAGRLISN